MLWLKVLILVVVLVGAGIVWYLVNRDSGGPSNCIGCGKCSGTGICILTGKPVGHRRHRK